ncbi:MAG: OmpP1/FadL family transporter [Panacagrimonas sp.]
MNLMIRLVAVATGLALCGSASALNGFFAHGYGTQSKAMGGAGVALALDGLTPATNPAGIAWLDSRNDVALSLFNPVRGYTATGTPTGACASATQCTFGIDPETRKSRRELFPVPSFGLVRPISDRSAWGLAVFGSGGLNTDYKDGSATFGVPTGTVPPGQRATASGVFGAGDAGIDLSQLFVVATYARKLGDEASWGISPIFAGERFAAKGLSSFAAYSADPEHLSNKGHDLAFGGGARIGVQGTVLPGLKLGASWQSRIYMSRLTRYAGLFAERGRLDIPSNFTIGLAATPISRTTLAFDVQRILFSEVNAVGNPLLPNLTQARLGDSNGAGFGWRDMTIYKLGVAIRDDGDRTWRFGYSYGTQQIPDSQVFLNVLGPSVVRHHITAGLTQKLEHNRAWNVSFMYAPQNAVVGQNPLDPAQRIAVRARMMELEFGYSWGL